MNRRNFIRSGLIALAATTGLARASIELLDDTPPVLFAEYSGSGDISVYIGDGDGWSPIIGTELTWDQIHG